MNAGLFSTLRKPSTYTTAVSEEPAIARTQVHGEIVRVLTYQITGNYFTRVLSE